MKNTNMTRRGALRSMAGASLAAAAAESLTGRLAAADDALGGLQGRVHHSVCKWCYGDIPLDAFCAAAKPMGLTSVELLQPSDFPTLKKHGLTCAMVSNPTVDGLGGIGRAWNRLEHHDKLVAAYEAQIQAVSNAGMERLICFSGNRAGMDDAQGLEHCATGLKRIMGTAEKRNVTIVMELLNSRVDHKDYMCDRTAWGAALCERVGSDRFKLLYDIYHMQIMEGDVIATIRKNKDCIAHYHTGGVPGRHEIDDTQELNYPAIMKAILETGYTGFVAQEFIPARKDKLASLRQGVVLCDVS
jgi:hydroxypyruvate isomerase